jgi:hypothetical protein
VPSLMSWYFSPEAVVTSAGVAALDEPGGTAWSASPTAHIVVFSRREIRTISFAYDVS